MARPKALDGWPKHFQPTYGPYRAIVDRWKDADTGVFLVDLGFGHYDYIDVRLLDYSSPESQTTQGEAATAYTENLLPPGSRARLHANLKGAFAPTLSRWVAGIEMEDGRWLGEVLFKHGHARQGSFEG